MMQKNVTMTRVAVMLALVLSVVALSSPSAQISIPNTFTANTRVVSADVNTNFSTLGAAALNRTGGTMSGTLTTANVLPDGHNTRDLGATATRFRDGWFGRDLAVTGVATVATLVVGTSTAVTGIVTNTVTWDPPAIAVGADAGTTVTITGIAVSTPCMVGGNLEENGGVALGVVASAYYQAANTARVAVYNVSAGSSVDFVSTTMRVTCFLY